MRSRIAWDKSFGKRSSTIRADTRCSRWSCCERCASAADPNTTPAPYCDELIAGPYGIKNQCIETLDNIKVGQHQNPVNLCIVDANGSGVLDAGDMPNIANTASTRPRLSLQGYDYSGDGTVDSAWVIVAAEESKGLGIYAFLPDGTPVTENDPNVGGILVILGMSLASTNYMIDTEVPVRLFELPGGGGLGPVASPDGALLCWSWLDANPSEWTGGSVLADLDPSADPQAVVKALRQAMADRNDVHIQVTAEQVRIARQSFQTMRVVLLVLTVLSLITSVLGVFSVIYVTIQTRRTEIGMLKAIGITGWQLVGTFAIESLTLTVSSTLAGTVAGTGLGYLFYSSNNMMQNVPTMPAFDTLTVTFVLTMVVVASLVSAAIASRGIVRQRVTQILRGV